MDVRTALLQTIHTASRKFSPYNLLTEQLIHLPFNRPIYIFALGKAAYQMTEAVLNHAKHEQFIRIMGGLVITRQGYVKGPLDKMKIIQSGHPLPNEQSFEAGEEAIRFLSNLKETDILLVLLSGGGSAMMEKPEQGFTREDIISRTEELLKNGSNIEVINTERKKMSAIKGGKLYSYIKSKFIFIYAMSDVPGDKPKYICSNPFLPDVEKAEEKMSLDNFHRYDGLTSSRFIPHDKAIVYKVIANNNAYCDHLRTSALEFFPNLQFDRIHIISTDLAGEAVKTGREIADMALFINNQKTKGFTSFRTPCLLIFGGETYVNVRGKGVGGRCTELALAAAEGLARLQNVTLAAYATDGQDGFCEAAGAVVDNHTYQALLDKGINVSDCLDDNDSYTALKAVDAIIPNELTGINVNDVVLLFVM